MIDILTIIDLCIIAGFATSKSESRRLITQGCIYLNNNKIIDPGYEPSTDELLYDKYFLLRKGKKNFKVVKMDYVCDVKDLLNKNDN